MPENIEDMPDVSVSKEPCTACPRSEFSHSVISSVMFSRKFLLVSLYSWPYFFANATFAF